MKVTLENTDRFVQVQGPGGAVPGRVWQGYSENGLPVVFVVTLVQVPAECDQTIFARQLRECAAPRADALVIPLRFIL